MPVRGSFHPRGRDPERSARSGAAGGVLARTSASAAAETPPGPGAAALPLVSVILAVRNEAGSLAESLASLRAQQTSGFAWEILAIDGDSTDGTREILEEIASRDSRVRVLRNEKRRTPFAFNLGLREARGEFVAILGAHTLYAPDYLAVCLQELRARDAGGCGGRVLTTPAAETLAARLVAAVLSHPFGSSRKSFRTQREGFVDTVNYPVLRKSALLEAGGYDEDLLRNQDNDMNQKLRERGQKLYCTWKTRCFYRPKGTLGELMAYARGNGFWNVVSWRKNRAAMGARHFIPFLFLAALLVTGVLALGGQLRGGPYATLAAAPFVLLLGFYFAAAGAAALQSALRQRWAGALCLPAVFFGFHLSYGWGTLQAILAGAKPGAAPSRGVGDRPDSAEARTRPARGGVGQPTMEGR